MADEYGVTAAGYRPKTQEVIRAENDADIRERVGNKSLPLGDKTVLGALSAMVAERAAELWELGEVLEAAGDPDAATDTLLQAVCAYTGTVQHPATPSTVTMTLTGVPATTVTEGSQIQTESEEVTVTTDEDATIAALSAWVEDTDYDEGDRFYSGANAYECTTAGHSDADPGDGPTSTDPDEDIVDGTAHHRFLGEGIGAVDVEATATENGPLVATAGDLTVIVTPVVGWTGAINVDDADLGTNVDTDEELRIRREQELSGGGTATPDAIRAALLKNVDDIESASILFNPGDTTDGDGLPPHSVEAIVVGGTDQAVRDVLLAYCVAAGIRTYGSTSGTAEDSEGTSHTIYFTRPAEIRIYADATVEYDENADAPPDTDAIKLLMTGHVNALGTGHDVRARPIGTAISSSTADVVDVPSVKIGTSASPTLETTIVITKRQIADLDSDDIDITLTPVAP